MTNNNGVFLDTSFAIALASHRDQYHKEALKVAEELDRASVNMVTTRAVMLEIGNACSLAGRKEAGVKLLRSLERDSEVDIVPMGEELYDRGFRLYAERDDKDWGLTDCISFELMRGRNIEQALTADRHFIQAGFRALLLE